MILKYLICPVKRIKISDKQSFKNAEEMPCLDNKGSVHVIPLFLEEESKWKKLTLYGSTVGEPKCYHYPQCFST